MGKDKPAEPQVRTVAELLAKIPEEPLTGHYLSGAWMVKDGRLMGRIQPAGGWFRLPRPRRHPGGIVSSGGLMFAPEPGQLIYHAAQNDLMPSQHEDASGGSVRQMQS